MRPEEIGFAFAVGALFGVFAAIGIMFIVSLINWLMGRHDR